MVQLKHSTAMTALNSICYRKLTLCKNKVSICSSNANSITKSEGYCMNSLN